MFRPAESKKQSEPMAPMNVVMKAVTFELVIRRNQTEIKLNCYTTHDVLFQVLMLRSALADRLYEARLTRSSSICRHEYGPEGPYWYYLTTIESKTGVARSGGKKGAVSMIPFAGATLGSGELEPGLA